MKDFHVLTERSQTVRLKNIFLKRADFFTSKLAHVAIEAMADHKDTGLFWCVCFFPII